jgi:aminopeptidase N
MPLKSTENRNTISTFEFEDTPPIPSYLVAFAFGNFMVPEQELYTSTLAIASIRNPKEEEEEEVKEPNGKLPLKVFVPSGFYSDSR